MNISIGKYTLESLTAGMYLSPRVLYREYIQNAIDSIDEAISLNLITKEQGKVIIVIDKEQHKIVIEDNGIGIVESEAIRALLDVGNSKKTIGTNKGFRGIGRLIGLGYSSKLTFLTTSKGENIATEICYDCEKLSQLLLPGQIDNYNLVQVLEMVVAINKLPSKSDEHYFKVILDGVKNIDNILETNQMRQYISEIAPVPYDIGQFRQAKKIYELFTNKGIRIDEYNIYISDCGKPLERIFKLYKDEILTDKNRKILDTIKDIKSVEIVNEDSVLIGLVWYGESNLNGTILDDDIKGLRLRKGNILIGDKNTLDNIFKESRFNGWVLGEVFVFDNNIIPNARRDNFEQNKSYLYFLEKLKIVGENLSRKIRQASTARLRQGKNQDLPEKEYSEINFDYLSVIDDNVDDSIETSDDRTKEVSMEKDPFRQLKVLLGNQAGVVSTKYKILNVSQITVSEKKLLEKVFDIILESANNKEGLSLIDTIIEKLNLTS